MPEAFGVSFVCALVAPNASAANEKVGRLRELSRGMGFDPGPGRVHVLAPGELAKLPELSAELEAARVRARQAFGLAASDRDRADARGRLVSAIDDETVELMIAALERALGYLPRSVARELARGTETSR